MRLSTFNKKQGQTLVLFIVMFAFIVTLLLATININRIAEEQIKMQIAADTAALSASRNQCLAMTGATLINDYICVYLFKMGQALGSMAIGAAKVVSIVGFKPGVAQIGAAAQDFISAAKSKKDLIENQAYLIKGFISTNYIGSLLMSIVVGTSNDASFSTIYPITHKRADGSYYSHPHVHFNYYGYLQQTDDWDKYAGYANILGAGLPKTDNPFSKLLLKRKDKTIPEKTTVVALRAITPTRRKSVLEEFDEGSFTPSGIIWLLTGKGYGMIARHYFGGSDTAKSMSLWEEIRSNEYVPIGKSWLGNSLTYKPFKTQSSATIYHAYYTKSLSESKFDDEILPFLVPGPWWQSRLVETGLGSKSQVIDASNMQNSSEILVMNAAKAAYDAIEAGFLGRQYGEDVVWNTVSGALNSIWGDIKTVFTIKGDEVIKKIENWIF